MTVDLTPADLDLLDGLFAWDNGARCSGIQDSLRRASIIPKVKVLGPEARRSLAEEILPEDQGFGSEDWEGFVTWLEDISR